MRLTTYAQTLHDVSFLKDQGLEEVILGHRDFSRFGKLSGDEYVSLAGRARDLGLRVIFEWDILMTENTFSERVRELPRFLESIDALRVQDPGALEWSFKNTEKPLQFIAENGNHNLVALKGWVEHVEGRLERLVLSIELTKTAISDYVKDLGVPCELLGMGRILLFYTPRALLTPLASESIPQNEELTAIGESEESPHKGFPIVENRHGTFMFHIKEFCLVDHAQDLDSAGLSYFRVDLRWEKLETLRTIRGLLAGFTPETFEAFKAEYPQDFMRGFYLVNKTDVLFPKLKNHRLQKREGDYVGEVLEAEKGSHLAILVKNPRGLKKTDKLKIVHPKGDVFEVPIYSLRNLSLDDVETIPAQTVALVQYVGGVWVKSHVFYGQD